MNVAIIKYNAGNIFSVDYALKRLGVEPIIILQMPNFCKRPTK